MARGFFRRPSFWKMVAAYRASWKRALLRFFMPWYGRRGMGWWNDPKKAVYNWWYNRTSVSIPRLLGYKPSMLTGIFAMSCAFVLNLVAGPVDVAGAASRARGEKKKRTASSGHPASQSSRKGAGRDTQSPVRASSGKDALAQRVGASQHGDAERKGKAETRVEPSQNRVAPKENSRTPQQTTISSEDYRLFDLAEPKPVPVDDFLPDENTPKSVPKSQKDQYIRKRMIIAGSRYSNAEALAMLKVGSYFELEAEPDNPYDKDAVRLVYNGEKIGYIPRQETLPYVMCLKLGKRVYGVITAIKQEGGEVLYEFETWRASIK